MFSQRTNWKLSANRFTQTLQAIRASGTKLLDLTISNPTECGLQYDTAAILAAYQNPNALRYDPQPKGLLSAREEVAGYYLRDHHVSVNPESILLTTGTSEAYSYVFRLLCNPQDEILVPKPSYPLFDFLADLQDVTRVSYSLEYADGWLVDFKSIERALSSRTRAILLVHPNNPTGSYLRAEEAEHLNKLCQQHNLALIVDEVFLDYSFGGIPARSFAANSEALTFTLSGLSKIAALPQMKVAWLVTGGPGSLVRPALDRLEVIADTYLSLNAATQWAVPALFDQRHAVQPQLLQRVRENRANLHKLVSSRPVCELLDADAGWHAVLRVPARGSDEDLVIELLHKQNVIVHPGHFYDFAKDGFLVLSLITPTGIFREGISRLLKFVDGFDPL
jgi:aspartate/methionine/tyrosine aminotransferase